MTCDYGPLPSATQRKIYPLDVMICEKIWSWGLYCAAWGILGAPPYRGGGSLRRGPLTLIAPPPLVHAVCSGCFLRRISSCRLLLQEEVLHPIWTVTLAYIMGGGRVKRYYSTVLQV